MGTPSLARLRFHFRKRDIVNVRLNPAYGDSGSALTREARPTSSTNRRKPNRLCALGGAGGGSNRAAGARGEGV